MRLIRNSTFLKGVVIFLSFVMIQSGFELHAQKADHSKELNELVKKYNKEEYDEVIAKLEHLLNEVGEDQGQIRGKFFLLLGASHEKKGNKDKAVENYLLGDILLGNLEVEGINLRSLKFFNSTIYGKVINGKRVFEKVGKRKRKKKFPYFAILGVAALVTAVLLLSKKKKRAEVDEQLNELNAKDVFDSIEWIEIPVGEFIMGDNTGTGSGDEIPVHPVYLDSYKISKYEITFSQYYKFVDAQSNSQTTLSEYMKNRPITGRSHHNVSNFCLWMIQYTNKSIFLPTEAQWEKAARGTDQRFYVWGNTPPDCFITNYNKCTGATSSVGSYSDDRSFYGVMDMGGNVSEMVKDNYTGNFYSYSPYSNPEGPSSDIINSYKVRRGGNYYSSVIRASNRDSVRADRRDQYTGFRIVWLD